MNTDAFDNSTMAQQGGQQAPSWKDAQADQIALGGQPERIRWMTEEEGPLKGPNDPRIQLNKDAEHCVQCIWSESIVTVTIADTDYTVADYLGLGAAGAGAVPGGAPVASGLSAAGILASGGEGQPPVLSSDKVIINLIVCANGRRFVGVMNVPKGRVAFSSPFFGGQPANLLKTAWIDSRPGGKSGPFDDWGTMLKYEGFDITDRQPDGKSITRVRPPYWIKGD